MGFFLRKQIIKFSCTSWSLLLCKINKKTWEQIQRYEDVILFLFPNNQIALNKTSFQKTINIIPMSLLAYFIVQNCKTIFTVDPELWGRMHQSGSQMAHLLQTKSFSEKPLIQRPCTLLAQFIVELFLKKLLEPIQSYDDMLIFDPKWLIFCKNH